MDVHGEKVAHASSSNATWVVPSRCEGGIYGETGEPCEWNRLRVCISTTSIPGIELWGYEDAHRLFCSTHGGMGGSVTNADLPIWLQDMRPDTEREGSRLRVDHSGRHIPESGQ